MKKILVVAVMAIMSLGAFAQSWYAGGSFGFWRNAGDNETNFEILPEVGYNLKDNVAVGATVGFGYDYKAGFSLSQFKVAPYLRYSFFKTGGLSLFVDGGVDLGIGSSKVDGHSSDAAVTYGIGFKPGISYALTNNFSLVAHLGFFGYEGGNKASHRPDQGGLKIDGNDLSFGFYYNF